MFSLACVFDSVGYDKLLLDPFGEPIDGLLSISGTTAILCDFGVFDVDDDDVRRSFEGLSWRRSRSSSLEVEELVLRDDLDDLLLCRSFLLSRSSSLSLLFGLVRSRSGSLLRRRGSEELSISACRGGDVRWCHCDGISSAAGFSCVCASHKDRQMAELLGLLRTCGQRTRLRLETWQTAIHFGI